MDNLFNKMYASELIIPSDISELDAQLILGETTTLDSEVSFRVVRKNRMAGNVNTVKMVPESVVLKNNIQDTYVREEMPYMSFKDSNVIKSGILNNESFFGIMRFDNLDTDISAFGSNLLSLKLVVTPVDGKGKGIILNELDDTFKAYNVSYSNHPIISEELGGMTYDAFKNIYTKDLTDYAKQIISGTRTHNGFAFTSEGIVNIYSSEAYYGQPKLIVEYIDPNKFQTENEIPAEVKFLETSELLVELVLAEPYPILNSEVILSKIDMAAGVIFAEYVSLDAQVTIMPTVAEIGVLSDLIFSKDFVDSEFKLIMATVLMSEVEYRAPDELELDSEVVLMFSSARPALVNLAFPGNTEIDAELKCYTNDWVNLDAEVELKNLAGAIIDSEVKLYTTSNLDAECELMFKDEETSLFAELEFTKNMLSARVRFSPSVVLDAELELALFSNLDAEMMLYVETDLDSEVNVALVGTSAIESETSFMNSNVLDAEVNFVLFEHLDAEMMLYVETDLDSEVNVALVGSESIESETSFMNSNVLNAEVVIFSKYGLNAETTLLFNSHVDSEMMLYTTSNLDAEMMLYVETDLASEFVLHLIGMGSVEAETIFMNSDSINAEVELSVEGEAYLEAEFILQLIGDNHIDSEVKLAFSSELESECNLCFETDIALDACVSLYTESIIDSEVKVMFVSELQSECNLCFETDIALDSECEFRKHLRCKIYIIQDI